MNFSVLIHFPVLNVFSPFSRSHSPLSSLPEDLWTLISARLSFLSHVRPSASPHWVRQSCVLLLSLILLPNIFKFLLVVLREIVCFAIICQGQRKICSTMLPALRLEISHFSQTIPCRCAISIQAKEKISSRRMLRRTWLNSYWHLRSVRYGKIFFFPLLNIFTYWFTVSDMLHLLVFPIVQFSLSSFCPVFCSVVSSVWKWGGHGAPLGHRGPGHWAQTAHLWHDI